MTASPAQDRHSDGGLELFPLGLAFTGAGLPGSRDLSVPAEASPELLIRPSSNIFE